MADHKWGPSRVGHGEAQCVWCHCTNREALVLGMECTAAPTDTAKNIEQHSIVQVVPEHQWAGCLVVVDEVKSWGMQGYVQVPMGGQAYIRLKWEEFEPITNNRAIFTPEKGSDDV